MTIPQLIAHLEEQVELSEEKAKNAKPRCNDPEVSFHTLANERTSVGKYCIEKIKELPDVEKEMFELKARLDIADPDGETKSMLYDDDGNLIEYS